MRKLVKSIIVCMFAVTLVGTMMPNTFVATAHAAAGAQDGQIEYIGGTKSTAEGDTYDIAVSKTIEPVAGKENYFDITLKTTSHKHKVDVSTDVIIVMDISNTMNKTIGESEVIKLDQAKAATKQFVKQYCTEADLAPDRRLGIVTFNTNAQIAVDLKEANSLNVYEADFEEQIDDITAPDDPSVKYTNIEGGLQLAYNILEESTAKNKFVILLTDGFPTTYIESDGTSKTKINGYSTYTDENGENFSTFNDDLLGKDNNGILKNPGYMVNKEVKKICSAGVDYSDYGAQRAQAVAEVMKNDKDDNYNIFSVGIGIGGMSIKYYLDLWKNSTFSTVDTNGRKGSGNTYTIGNATETASYKTWLGSSIAGGKMLSQNNSVRYSDGDSAEELSKAYAGILNTIKVAPNSVMNEFYTIDPMSDVADFVGFYNKSGALADNPNALIGESKLNAENSAVYGETGNKGKIHWDMSNSGFTKNGEEFVYELKYRVRLTNEADGFKWNTEYEMNDTTTFYYSQKYTATGEKVPGSDGSLNYPIPKTEGYKGILKLKKTDGDTNEALANVEFTLKHLGEKCPVCNGDADISDMTEKSDENGCLEFDNIPSGHKYTLVENEPNGYAPVDGFDVEVAYGETLINDMLVTADENGYFGIVNRELAMNGTKTLNGKPAAENAFEFAIQQISDEGKAVGNEIVVKNGKDGKIEFTGILKNIVDDITSEVSDSEDPTSELVRTYKIYEKAGVDTDITYDDTYYLLKVGAKEQEGTAYYKYSARLQKVDEKGTTPLFEVNDSYSIKITPELKFENTSKIDFELKATKVLESVNIELQADDYTFILKAKDGDVIQTVKNDEKGNIAFEAIEYTIDDVGEHTYTVYEQKGDNKSLFYDDTVYTVKVNVSVSETGELAITGPEIVDEADEAKKQFDRVVFTNKDMVPVKFVVKAAKLINGNEPTDSQEFDFELAAIGENGNATQVEIAKNDKDEVIFSEIELNAIGTYSYVVREVLPDDDDDSKEGIQKNGYTYDETEHTVVIDVADSDNDGILEKVVKVDGVEKGTEDSVITAGAFENTYEADPIAISPVVSKTLTGREWNDNDEFTFKITPDESTKEAIINQLVAVSKDTVVINKENKDQEMAFEDIIFNAPGIYKFVISEEKGDIDGVNYDEHEVNVTVEVTDSGVGNLIAAATYQGLTEFVNKYTPEPIVVALEGQKNLDGRELKAGEFEFTIDAVTEDAPLPANTKATNGSDGKISFGTMMYNEAGTYEYLITEENNGLPAVGYDENAVSATVTVEYHPATGKYSASVAYDKAGENEFVFNNTYSPAPITISFGGTKTVVPSEGNSYELAAETFSFKLIASDDNPSTDPLSGEQIFTHDKNGKINIDAEYNEPGIYEYTLSELSQSIMPMSDMPEKNDGIVYDTTVHNIVVNVTDDGCGNLSAVVETPKTRSADSGISFNNGYAPTETSTTIYGIKTINNGTKAPAAGDFNFTISAKTEGAPLPDVTKVYPGHGASTTIG
ncbi:MAG: FctA domain-containing protein, partial [Bacillota bacterium]|nr:FctA domain-containing protein [Bacillota bacterium]